MTTTPDFGIPELAQAQATPEITFNEALILYQALLNGVMDATTSVPPGAPTEGDSYIVGSSPSGAWSGYENHIAIYYNGGWRFVPGVDDSGSIITIDERHEGMRVFDRDAGELKVWQGSPLAWTGIEAAAISTIPVAYGFALSDEETPLEVATSVLTVRMPHAMTLTGVRASLSSASSTGTVTVDINEGGVTILSTKLTIDATERTSTTAVAPAVISDSALADDAELTFDIDDAGGSPVDATGLKVWLIGTRAI